MPFFKHSRVTVVGANSRKDSEGTRSINRTWKMIVVSVVPVVALIIQNAILLSSEVTKLEQFSVLKTDVNFGLALGSLLHQFQTERTATVYFLNSKKNSADFAKLSSVHIETEGVYERYYSAMKSDHRTPEIVKLHDEVINYRLEVWQIIRGISDVIHFYSNINKNMLNMIGETVESTVDGGLWHSLISFYMLVLGKEKMEFVAADGITALVDGSLPILQYAEFCAALSRANGYIEKSMDFSKIIRDKLQTEFYNTPLEEQVTALEQEIYLNNGTGSVEKEQMWYNNMTTFAEILRSAELKIQQHILTKLDEQETNEEVALIMSVALMLTAIVMFPIVLFLILRMTSTIRGYANTLKTKTLDLKRERKKTEKLLHEILPVSVAEKLMKNEVIKPKYYESVTIYFSDIVGFTTLSSKSTPIQVVDMLNVLYNTFDERLELYDVYKVETIGDAYMVVSGLPETNGYAHSAEMALTALDLLYTVSTIQIPHLPDTKLRLRIGLNTGPTVAGVVGLKMPRYCLFGDTVNTASRMESTGLPQKVQISSSTFKELVTHHKGFYIEERGEIEVKGKGMMMTYFLTGIDSELHKDR